MQPWYGKNWRSDSLISETKWIKYMADKYKIFIFIIHSWTKFFSCTGLRIGSVICPNTQLYNNINNIKNPWNVNVLALEYIKECIKDDNYMNLIWNNTSLQRKKQINDLKNIFNNWTFHGENFISWIWINTKNSYLAEICYEFCKYNGVPIRWAKISYNCDTYIRIAVRNNEYFEKLLNIFKKINVWISLKSNIISNESKLINYYHININNNIVKYFDYIEIDKIKIHEKFIESRHESLIQYIKNLNYKICIPSIIVCHKTLTMIDGHHRLSIFKHFNKKYIPTLFIDYKNEDIIVNINSTNISKELVINSAKSNILLEPKSTSHHIYDLNKKLYPIITIAPNVYFDFSTND